LIGNFQAIKRPAVHVLSWCIFALMWNRIMYFYISNPLNRLYFSALDVSLIIVTFYLLYSWIIPWYLKRKSFLLFAVACAALVAASAGFYSWLMWLLLNRNVVPIGFSFSWNYLDLQYNRFFIALVGILSGAIVKLAVNGVQASRQIAQLEKARSEAELGALKAQINPHFLFNSLNSLYAQLDIKVEDAKETLSTLAEMLRYQLYECNTDTVLLTSEIGYIGNYFTLQSLRKDNCRCEFTADDVPGQLQIAPLLLLPFVENAFKHVSDHDKNDDNFVVIKLLFREPGWLTFECINTTGENSLKHKDYSGMGLSNVRKRLELIYNDRHTLQLQDNGNTFNARLQINLK
jgi:two-component system LytT family sensor kinase